MNSSCGAESNRHSGAVGTEKRAEQGNPGGGHVTEPQLSEPYERKAAGMNPRPAADSSTGPDLDHRPHPHVEPIKPFTRRFGP